MLATGAMPVLNTAATVIIKPGTERVQALADILHLVLCCHSNETCALIANPSNSAQLEVRDKQIHN